ncbi:MAG: LysM peptidoglycan-binding domain-containing protein [Chlamydiota bacterium]
MKLGTSLTITLLASLLASCSSVEYAERQQLDTTSSRVQKLQASVDDQNYRLNSHNVEMEILEGKVTKLQNNLANINTNLDKITNEQKSLQDHYQRLDQQLATLNKGLDKFPADIRRLQDHANLTANSLEQYKGKINTIEKNINTQNQRITKLFDSINLLTSLVENKPIATGKTHKVRSGDSLDKIAKRYNTSIEALKKINRLKSDLIVVGQELKIPE